MNNEINIYDILKYKRSIEVWDTLWYDEVAKIRRKLIKFDKETDQAIIMQLSGSNDAKSESMVIFDLMNMLKSQIYTIGAGGVEQLNGLLYLAGDKKIAYPNMWLRPWWPLRTSVDIEESGFNPTQHLEDNPNRLDSHIIEVYSNLLGYSYDKYKEICFSNEVILATELLEMELIDSILDKDSNWLVELLK